MRISTSLGYLTTAAALLVGVALVAGGHAAYGWALLLTAPVVLYLLSGRSRR